MNMRHWASVDPFSTSLERAAAEVSPTVGGWEAAWSRAVWSRYTASERAEMTLYWAAYRENDLWNAAVVRSWDRKTFWSVENGSWRGETDEEFASRTAKLKWRPGPNGFEFIGAKEIRRAA